jgi:hypothetical protein
MPVKKRTPWLEALYAAMPLCFSYIPVGLWYAFTKSGV